MGWPTVKKDWESNKNDKVAVLFANCPEIIESYCAIIELGAVAVFLNFGMVEREPVFQINNSDSKIAVFS